SGGMYILSREAREYVDLCIEGGQTRMRDFQRSLVGAGLRVRAYEFSKIIDVDHAADIAVAEQLTKK
ncbi:MAG: NDP-sugar synthase, partial [Duncaniella sp.]|nr:NDP-sugar synthase [Duncaniella sp.]